MEQTGVASLATMSALKSEVTLMERVGNGDQLAFTQLYKNYRQALLHAIILIVKDKLEAEDILHDTYLKLWQRAPQYDPQRGGVYNWLLNLARNTAIDALRQRQRISVVDLTESNAAELVSEWPVINFIGLRPKIDQRLTAAQRQLVELRYWQDCTVIEMANQLALPVGTVKTNLRQTLRLLHTGLIREYALMY